MKYESILRREVWKKYRELSPLGRLFCRLSQHNPDYSMFIAGIIAGVPATLLMNLVTISKSELSRPFLYSVLYLVSFVASVVFCGTFFRLSVLHEGLHKDAQKMAGHGLGTEEEEINDLVIVFSDGYKNRFRRTVWCFLGSMAVTVFGIAATFLAQNL